jgi:hypothetical protein
MDKKKLSEEIMRNMKQENGIVSLPLETWNKLAICLDKAEGTIAEIKTLYEQIETMRAYIRQLEEVVKPQAVTEELIAEPSLHIENFYVTINHFDKE